MSTVVIGMDPHKRSATIEVMTADEAVLGGGRYGTDAAGYRGDARRCARGGRSGPGRSRAARGSAGTWRPRLVAAGEQVVDVPPKLSARTRVFTAGQGRKTDATDAHSDRAGRHPDDRAAPGHRRRAARGAAGPGRPAPVPGRGPHPDDLPAAPAAAGADPRRGEEGPVRGPGQGAAGPGPAAGCGRAGPPPGRRRADRRPGTDLPAQEGRRQGADRGAQGHRHHADETWTGSARPAPPGCWSRSATSPGSPDRGHFASWNGTAPIDASSGDHVRHRLSRAGNRQINRVLHIMAVVQLRHATKGRAYYDRKVAAGKTSMEAMRASNAACPTSCSGR